MTQVNNSTDTRTIQDVTKKELSIETANIVHEINNSLSIILGNLQCMLLNKEEFSEKSLVRLNKIEDAAKKISESNDKILKINNFDNN